MGIYAGYRRVSRVGDRAETLRSPKDQAKAIEGWAKRTGNTVELLPPEMDRSGGDATRPILLGAIARVETGELDGIVVYRLDRFARSLSDLLAMIERVEAVGGEIVSATEQYGDGTNGRMTRNIIGSIAEAERERQAEGFETAKANAIAEGIYVARAPLGYLKGADRKLVPDPKVGPVIEAAFKRRAAGESWDEIARFMADALGRDGMLPASVRFVVHNRAYLGVARMGEHINPSAHPPIVDRALFEAAQIEHARPPRGKHGTALLTGKIRCTGCGRRMTSSVGPKGRVYRCVRRHAGGDCPAPAYIDQHVDGYVAEAVLAHLRDGQVSYKARTDALAEATAALDTAERELTAYQEATEVAGIGVEHFAEGMRARVAAVEAARRELAEAHRQVPALPDVAKVADVIANLDGDELRHVLQASLGVVWVGKGRGLDRVRIVARGFEPAGLSVRGVPAGPPIPVELPESDLDGEVRPAAA